MKIKDTRLQQFRRNQKKGKKKGLYSTIKEINEQLKLIENRSSSSNG